MGYQIANSLYGIRLNLSGNKAYLEMNMTENQFNNYKIYYNENISHMFNGARNIADNFINNFTKMYINNSNYYALFSNCNNINYAWFPDTEDAYKMLSLYEDSTNINSFNFRPSWENLDGFGYGCYWYDGNAKFINNYQQSLDSIYSGCTSIKDIEIPDSWTDINNFAANCRWYHGNPVCGDNVTNMTSAYSNCTNLIGSPVCGNNVTSMINAYSNCTNLTGSPVCGDKVTSMYCTYSNCTKLIGSPVCGNNVTDMYGTYELCYNLTGSPVCGNNVTNMSDTYCYCNGLIGSPVCGDKVTDMSGTYSNCYNLTGYPVCGDNVTNMYMTYYSCPNLYGDMYCYNDDNSTSINMRNCFYGRNIQNRLNIHVIANCKFDNSLYNLRTGNGNIYGTALTWTDMKNGYYNAAYNTYVYNNLSQYDIFTKRKIEFLHMLPVRNYVGNYNIYNDTELVGYLDTNYDYHSYSEVK